MTQKELLLIACAEIEAKSAFLKRDIPKLEREIKKLRKEVNHLKATGGLICSITAKS